MDSLNNGSSNSPHGLTLYHAIEDHIFGGMMLEEYEDGNLYLDWEVDEKIGALDSELSFLKEKVRKLLSGGSTKAMATDAFDWNLWDEVENMVKEH